MIPQSAPLDAHHLWRRVYDYASSVYTRIPGYGLYDAELTADAALAGWWSGRRQRIHRGLLRAPRAGNLLNIGCFLNLAMVEPDGTIVVHSFSRTDRVPLYWSQNLKACFVFPGARLSQCVYRPSRREAALAAVWAKGRPATCARIGEFPTPPMPRVFPGVAITYLSDKFSHGRPKEYIHHFEKHVLCYMSASRGLLSPRAFMVRGGKLRLTPDGLEG